MKPFATIAVGLALAGALTPAAAQDGRPDQAVQRVLSDRNNDAREALLRALLSGQASADERHLRRLSIDLYASELRLQAIGVDRSLLRGGATVDELPARVLEERAGIVLDPWAPLAGKSFILPQGGLP